MFRWEGKFTKVNLIAYTPEPEKVVACAAKLCYSNADSIDTLMEGLTDEKVSKFIGHLASLGHGSTFEHASFTFAIEGVSRALLAQLTRHRIASYSVQSQRYVSMEGFSVVEPPAIWEDDYLSEIFSRGLEAAADTYNDLRDLLIDKYVEEGIDKGAAEKKANEDARYILPNAATTRLILTMNARSLLHFFSLRCCNRAQWEIRELAEKMLKLVYPIAPNLFANAGPGCVSEGRCPEGSMSCGKMAEMQEKYSGLKTS